MFLWYYPISPIWKMKWIECLNEQTLRIFLNQLYNLVSNQGPGWVSYFQYHCHRDSLRSRTIIIIYSLIPKNYSEITSIITIKSGTSQKKEYINYKKDSKHNRKFYTSTASMDFLEQPWFTVCSMLFLVTVDFEAWDKRNLYVCLHLCLFL